MKIDIGIFAHNEQASIENILADLKNQTLLQNTELDVRVVLLANACSDDTIGTARKFVQSLPFAYGSKFKLFDLPLGGKSRTWNYFVHEVARQSVAYLVFLDADIRISNHDHLEQLLGMAMEDKRRLVVTSRPVKDISMQEEKLGLIEKLIVSSSGSLSEYKTAICGQLYLAKAEVVENIYMPIGLPVEDGFLRAMILTDLLTLQEEDLKRIHCKDDVWHSYESIRTIGELIRHQTRIVIGSAINTMVFGHIAAKSKTVEEARRIIQESSNDERWLQNLTNEKLPCLPYGYVPWHFLNKRVVHMYRENRLNSIRALAIAVLGFSFDFIVYINASIKMAMGRGAGYW